MGQQLTTYVDKEIHDKVERRAQEAGLSKSAFLAQLIESAIEDDLMAQTSRETEIEQRIEELVAQAGDDIAQTAEQAVTQMQHETDLLVRLNLYSAMHSVGSWNLQSDEFGGARRQEAMQNANDSLQTLADQAGVNLNALGSTHGTSKPDSQQHRASADGDDDEWYF